MASSRVEMPTPIIVFDESRLHPDLVECRIDGRDDSMNIVIKHDPEAFAQYRRNDHIQGRRIHGPGEVVVSHEDAEALGRGQPVVLRTDSGRRVEKVDEHLQIGANIIGNQHVFRISSTAPYFQ